MQFSFTAINKNGTVMQGSLAGEGLRVTIDQTNAVTYSIIIPDSVAGYLVETFCQNIHGATNNELRHGNTEEGKVLTVIWSV